MRVEIADLYQRLNTTFIYVTHDQTEAMTLGTKIVVMKDGEIQQTDSPANLFNYPVNKFVAGFIGTPAMNFFDANVFSDQGILYLKTAEGIIRVTNEKAEKLRAGNWEGRRVLCGIRPEHVKKTDEEDTVFSGEVSVFELLGSNAIVYIAIDGQTIIMNTDDVTPHVHGEKIWLCVQEEKLHIFDPETERIITN